MRWKIKKSDRDWVTENRDNFREHIYDKRTNSWRFDYRNSALDNRDVKGPFIMSKLAASTMCETGFPWALHGQKKMDYTKIKHKDESESVLANICDEKDERRSHDFDDVSANETKVAGQEQIVKSKQPQTATPKGELEKDFKKPDWNVFYPKIISSSFVRKTKRKEVDDIEKWWPDKYYQEWKGLPLFVIDEKS